MTSFKTAAILQLNAMRVVKSICTRLGTCSYIWGGFTLDIYAGRLLRYHHDIDFLALNLFTLRDEICESFREWGWQTRILVNGDVGVDAQGIKLHLGHIEQDRVNNERTIWIHNQPDGGLVFPSDWLRPEPVAFCDTRIHVVAPEFEYVIKRVPQLLNPAWQFRKKDTDALQALEDMLQKNYPKPHVLIKLVESL